MGFGVSRRTAPPGGAPVDPSGGPGSPARGGVSLKGRALRLLAQREHSRVELSRKLGPYAESDEQLAAVLDELERTGLSSPRRFAESLAHRRAARFGLRRIEQELGAHRLDADVAAPVIAQLRGSERDRALAAWRRRFGTPPADATERARQHRFLAQRGFTAEAIGWVLRHGVHADDTPEPPPSGEHA